MSGYGMLVTAHIAAGTTALLAFWIAGLARKGRPLHRFAGRAFLLAMLGILASALPMSVFHLAQGRVQAGIFLAYLVVITATTCWLSWRAIRLKRDRPAYFGTAYRAVGRVNLVAGAGVLAIGVARMDALLSLFCWVGIGLGASMLRRVRKAPALPPNWWLHEHYGAMLGNGVATHVAFLGIGLGPTIAALGWPGLTLLPWLTPVAVAMAVGTLLDRRYGAVPSRRVPAASTATGG